MFPPYSELHTPLNHLLIWADTMPEYFVFLLAVVIWETLRILQLQERQRLCHLDQPVGIVFELHTGLK